MITFNSNKINLGLPLKDATAIDFTIDFCQQIGLDYEIFHHMEESNSKKSKLWIDMHDNNQLYFSIDNSLSFTDIKKKFGIFLDNIKKVNLADTYLANPKLQRTEKELELLKAADAIFKNLCIKCNF